MVNFACQNAHITIHASGDDQHVVMRVTKVANPNKMLILNYMTGTDNAIAIECTDIGLAEYVVGCLESNIVGPYIINTNFGFCKTVTTLDEMMLFVKDCITKIINIDVLMVKS